MTIITRIFISQIALGMLKVDSQFKTKLRRMTIFCQTL